MNTRPGIFRTKKDAIFFLSYCLAFSLVLTALTAALVYLEAHFSR